MKAYDPVADQDREREQAATLERARQVGLALCRIHDVAVAAGWVRLDGVIRLELGAQGPATFSALANALGATPAPTSIPGRAQICGRVGDMIVTAWGPEEEGETT